MTANNSEIIWAISSNGKFAHAYPGIDAIKTGVPLCGRHCVPVHSMEHFDLDNPVIQRVACPDCLARLAFAKYMKPISELYKSQKSTDVAQE